MWEWSKMYLSQCLTLGKFVYSHYHGLFKQGGHLCVSTAFTNSLLCSCQRKCAEPGSESPSEETSPQPISCPGSWAPWSLSYPWLLWLLPGGPRAPVVSQTPAELQWLLYSPPHLCNMQGWDPSIMSTADPSVHRMSPPTYFPSLNPSLCFLPINIQLYFL